MESRGRKGAQTLNACQAVSRDEDRRKVRLRLREKQRTRGDQRAERKTERHDDDRRRGRKRRSGSMRVQRRSYENQREIDYSSTRQKSGLVCEESSTNRGIHLSGCLGKQGNEDETEVPAERAAYET